MGVVSSILKKVGLQRIGKAAAVETNAAKQLGGWKVLEEGGGWRPPVEGGGSVAKEAVKDSGLFSWKNILGGTVGFTAMGIPPAVAQWKGAEIGAEAQIAQNKIAAASAERVAAINQTFGRESMERMMIDRAMERQGNLHIAQMQTDAQQRIADLVSSRQALGGIGQQLAAGLGDSAPVPQMPNMSAPLTAILGMPIGD